MSEYGVTLTKLDDVYDADCVIIAVAHNEFKAISLDDIKKLFKVSPDVEKVLIDVKGLYRVEELKGPICAFGGCKSEKTRKNQNLLGIIFRVVI